MRTTPESEVHPQHRRVELVDPHDASICVPVTAISLAPAPDDTPHEDVHVYRTRGPGADPEVGLPQLRTAWIESRGDVGAYAGRPRELSDDGRSAVRRGAASLAWRGRDRTPFAHGKGGP